MCVSHSARAARTPFFSLFSTLHCEHTDSERLFSLFSTLWTVETLKPLSLFWLVCQGVVSRIKLCLRYERVYQSHQNPSISRPQSPRTPLGGRANAEMQNKKLLTPWRQLCGVSGSVSFKQPVCRWSRKNSADTELVEHRNLYCQPGPSQNYRIMHQVWRDESSPDSPKSLPYWALG